MSNKYKHGDIVPTKTLIKRLEELSDAVTKGEKAINQEFVMRIPAELDHCPDLVLSQSSKRLGDLEKEVAELKAAEKKAFWWSAKVTKWMHGNNIQKAWEDYKHINNNTNEE